MTRPLLFFLFLLIIQTLEGQTITIHGQASDYAGKVLNFYTYPEPISHEPKELAKTTVQKDGSFALSFSLDQPTEIYTDLEKFRGTLVAVPGCEYQISLPPFSPRTAREASSPYFQPDLYWLSIKGAKLSDLNFLVRAFLTDYNKELATHTLDLYHKRSQDTLKAIIARLEKNYPTGKEPYFNLLKRHSYGELELAVMPQEKKQITSKYFEETLPALAHPAYQHLFNALCTDYLTVNSQDVHQKKFLTEALRGNFNGFVGQLTGQGLRIEFAELVAVKSFYDGYFSGKFAKRLMLKGLREAETQCTFQPLKNALPGILSKLTSLQEGNPAPALSLKDLSGGTTSLRANGKFIYLVFFKSSSKESKAELDSLVSIHQKLNQVLTVMPISLDQNSSDAIQLWTAKKYPWELTFPANFDKTISDYRVKTVPAFFLIAPDQKMILSPALPPTHNFESLFLKIFRESRVRQQGK